MFDDIQKHLKPSARDDDRDDTQKLSNKIDALKELKKEWLHHVQ